mgnify:CR=1 FL=1
MEYAYTRELAQMALGQCKAPLVFKNAYIVQVFTNEIIQGDIAVAEGRILGIGEYHGEQEIDLTGKYLCPGFIDAHLHLESTLVNPGELIRQAGLKGTTTFLVDPHEAANVAGCDGIDYILRETEESLANVYVMVPSCVPSGPFEDNGYSLDSADMERYKSNPRVLGLGEVMDCQAVLDCEEKMLGKLRLFSGKNIDGHAGYLEEKETNCYALAGIQTDHECCTFEDALREMRAGMQILVREGTAAKNLESIIRGVLAHRLPCHQLAFCTDDKHIEDIQKQGHISYNVRKAIQLGMDPVEAIKIATLYPARRYGLTHLGAVAPGYQADFVVLSDLAQVEVDKVYHKGRLVEQQELPRRETPSQLLGTVHIRLKGVEDLRLPLSGSQVRVMETVPGEILTRETIAKVKVKDGFFVADETYQKIAVLERHHATGKIGMGIVKGFFICGGAIATTVGHDSHNLIVIGDNDEDMYRAIRELTSCGGGYTVVETGREPLTLPLQVMGLISTMSHQEVKIRLSDMQARAKALGVPEGMDPFITMSFLALPVIPQVRVTTRGLYHVNRGCFEEIQVEE